MKFNRRAHARPIELLDAALARFLVVGFAATKVEEIAHSAGVTVGTVYRYFPSKEALFEQVVARQVDIEWSRGRELSEAYGSLTAREIVALLLKRWAEHLRQPGPRSALLLIVREGQTFPLTLQLYVEQLLSIGCRAIERAIRHGIERGEFALVPIELTARSLASTVIGETIWAATFAAHLPTSANTESLDLAIELAVRGLPRGSGDAAAQPARVAALATIAPTQDTGEPAVATGRVRIRTLRPPEHA